MPISSACRSSKRVERPGNCSGCGAAGWWNGTRKGSVRRKLGEQVIYVAEIVRRRARCSFWKDCRLKSWTVDAEDSYPHRVFDLAVVACAGSMVGFGRATHSAAARAHQCSRRSVGRWKRWVGELADPDELARVCTQRQARGLPGGLALSQIPRAGRVLHLLERLVELLHERGVDFPEVSCALGRVLRRQLEHCGEVFYLTSASPRLRADLGAIRFSNRSVTDREQRALEIASFRYRISADAAESLDGAGVSLAIEAAAERMYVNPDGHRVRCSVRTLWRWLPLYKKAGLNARRPKRRKDAGTRRAVPNDILERVVALRREKQERPTKTLIAIAERLRLVAPATLKRSTVARHLARLGVARRILHRLGIKVFHKILTTRPFELVVADFHHGPDVRVPGEDKAARTLFLAFIDHFSRSIPESRYDELNAAWQAGLAERYHRDIHSETAEAPFERFEAHVERRPAPDLTRIDERLRLRQKARVHKQWSIVEVRPIRYVVDPARRALDGARRRLGSGLHLRVYRELLDTSRIRQRTTKGKPS